MLSQDGHRKTVFDSGSLPHFGQRKLLTTPIVLSRSPRDYNRRVLEPNIPLFPACHHSNPLLRRPTFDLIEGFLKLPLQIPHIKPYSPRAVEGGNADHH